MAWFNLYGETYEFSSVFDAVVALMAANDGAVAKAINDQWAKVTIGDSTITVWSSELSNQEVCHA